MRVYIGPHKNWFGPYQLAEKLLFWLDKDKDDRVHDFGSWLAGGDGKESLLFKAMRWADSKRHRTIKVRIDDYDTWGMDHTLAYIALPMLKQLRSKQHGAPDVDDDEVPDELKKINADKQTAEEIENHHPDSNHFKRWNWVLDEMIFSFESQFNDWEEQFLSGDNWLTCEVNWDGRKTYQARITNGFRLFGKFYESLWD